MPPRRQSAASLPSHAPHGVRRGCWMNRIAGVHGEAMYTAPDCAARAALQDQGWQCNLSLGGPRGIFSFEKENIPLDSCSAVGAAIPTALCAESKKRGLRFRTAPFLCRFSSRSRYCSHSHCCSRSHFRQIEVKEL